MILEILLLITVIVGFALLLLMMQRNTRSHADQQQLEDMVNKIFGLTSQRVAEQSRDILRSEKETIHIDLENKQKTFEKLIQQLQEDMRQRQGEIRTLEQDRVQKFGEMSAALESHRKMAEDLRVSTQQLSAVLSNNQLRGEWGERIIEDLMRSNGLVENVHYLKQTKLHDTELRPDITLMLPGDRVVPVDVKFPYAEIQKMALADNKPAKDAHQKQFAIDLRNKINKVAEYINPAYNTLDYAILFVPNEMVFSFINQKFPDIVDEAVAKRVLIVSPFTFLIVARTVIESYRNFMIGDKLKEVVKYIDEFVNEWLVFKEEFSKFGRSLETLQSGYEKLTTTRTRQMEKKIEKIESYRTGSLAASSTEKLSETAEAERVNPETMESPKRSSGKKVSLFE